MELDNKKLDNKEINKEDLEKVSGGYIVNYKSFCIGPFKRNVYALVSDMGQFIDKRVYPTKKEAQMAAKAHGYSTKALKLKEVNKMKEQMD